MAQTRLSGIIIEDAAPAPVSMISAGDAALARERNKLFKGFVAGSRDIRTELLSAENALVERIQSLYETSPGKRRIRGGFVSDGSRLSAAGIKSMTSAVRREINSAFNDIGSMLDTRILNSVRQTIQSQSTRMQKLGFPPLTADRKKALEKTVTELFDREFPVGTGMTYRQRLDLIRQRRTAQILGAIGESYEKNTAMRQMSQYVRNSLSFRGEGTPISGGTAYKQVRRLMVAEESRLNNAVELAIYHGYGIEFVYWRLNPAHRWYGGQEICEFHSSAVNTGVIKSLNRLGLSPSDVSVEGLYTSEIYPQYPHPFCKCYPEPLYVDRYVARKTEKPLELKSSEMQEIFESVEVKSADEMRNRMFRVFGLNPS